MSGILKDPQFRKQRAANAAQARWKKAKGEHWKSPLPQIANRGTGILGNNEIECYVLSNGERVLSYRQAVKLITGKETGKIGNYISILIEENGGVGGESTV